tara:strand:- start:2793 stop:3176 length:384 start_codon:yes stop_codon:yes gene_type:complete
MYITNIENLDFNYREKLDANFWDGWIGPGEFDMWYLNKVFNYKNKKKYLLLMDDISSNNMDNISGILVYYKFKFINLYKILLLAKKKHYDKKGVGKLFITYILNNFHKTKFILVDDSGIPNYYDKLY